MLDRADPDGRNHTPLLQVVGLRTELRLRNRVLPVVQDVSFHLDSGETLGIVGESGCGKSMTALSVMRLVPSPPGRIESGSIRFAGTELLQLPEREMRRLRGNSISMIFQEPMTSLNPVRTVGSQIIEAIRLHQGLGWRAARARAAEMLDLVHIPDAQVRLDEYPHHLSGGMRQRVTIAMALSCNPRLLLADEPTTALDVTIQAQIMSVLAELRDRMGMALVLITHDLGLVAESCDRVLVMYAGRKIEEAPTAALFAAPAHPYTRGLLNSVPHLAVGSAATGRAGARQRLREISGTVPALDRLPSGCPYEPRCPLASDQCRSAMPPLLPHDNAHLAACWHSARVPEIAQ
ncbi:MAG TPA: ABC transporter ATP-binding protein [Acetobacteraceae bacterium]